MSEESETPSINFEQVAELGIMSYVGIQFIRGEGNLRKRRWAKASTAFRRIIAVTGFQRKITPYSLIEKFGMPDTAPRTWAFYKLGLALEQLPDLPKAAEALDQAVAADPGLMEARMALARVAAERSHYDQAIDEYKKACNFVEETRDNYSRIEADRVCCDILTRLGSLLIDMDRQVEAQEVLERAVSMYSDNLYALANCAVVAGNRGDEISLRKYLSVVLEKVRPGVDSNIINDLLQYASNADYGDVVLEMLLAHRRIVRRDFTRCKKGWQRGQFRKGSGSIQIDNSGEVIVNPGNGNFISNHDSSIGVQGYNATNNSVSQQFKQVSPALNVDLYALVAELEELKSWLLSEATDPGHYQVVAEIVSARKAAEESDQPALLRHLRAGGQWALEVASRVGTSVAETAIKAALKLP